MAPNIPGWPGFGLQNFEGHFLNNLLIELAENLIQGTCDIPLKKLLNKFFVS